MLAIRNARKFRPQPVASALGQASSRVNGIHTSAGRPTGARWPATTKSSLSQGRGILCSSGPIGGSHRASHVILSYRAASTSSQQPPKEMLVLYGSQMGTGEAIAKELAEGANRRGIKTNVMSMAEFHADSMDSLPEHKVVTYVVSTFGNGEFPDNAEKFYNVLNQPSLADKGWLKGTSYTVFGLGYALAGSHFNEAAKTLDAKLTSLGGKCFHSVAYSDEHAADGHDTALKPWTEGLWKQLGVAEFQVDLKPSYTVYVHEDGTEPSRLTPPGYKNASVKSSKMLTPQGYDRPVIELELDVAGSSVNFGLCDQALFLPRNPPKVVEKFCDFLGLHLDTMISLHPVVGASKLKIPDILSVSELLSQYVDLSAAPTRKLISYLAQLAQDNTEATELTQIAESSEKHQALVQSFVTTAEFMLRYPSIASKCSLDLLTTILPQMKPRSYSIASSPTTDPTKMRLIVAVPKRDNFVGLCSGYLASLKPGSKLPVSTASALISHEDPTKPVILVALGTGIGSVVAILEERRHLMKKGMKVGPCHVYFSIRHKATDYILKEELEKFQNDGVITKLETIFTHDGEKPTFVMDRIIQNRKELFNLLEQGSFFHYCGLGGQAPVLVEEAVKKAVETGLLITSAQAHMYIERLKRSGRWTIESFGSSLLDDFAVKAKRVGRKRLTVDDKNLSVPEIFEGSNMFCYQCEQTFESHGCHDGGVCGKTPQTSAMQDLLLETLKGLSQYAVLCRQVGLPEDTKVNHLVMESLFATLTNVNFDSERFVVFINETLSSRDRLRSAYLAHCKATGTTPVNPTGPAEFDLKDRSLASMSQAAAEFGVLNRLTKFGDDVGGLQEMLMYGVKGMAAYAAHAERFGHVSLEVNQFMQEALDFLTSPDAADLGKTVGMVMKCGNVGFTTLKLLDAANTTLGTPTPTKVSRSPIAGKAILVTGHDLRDLELLLEQTEGKGINIFTHGEMLPAHSYPGLKKYKHLVGHFGTAWQMQQSEFSNFPGAILATTNCIVKPKDSYADRMFTCNAVGWPGIKHIPGQDFSALIDTALKAPGFLKDQKLDLLDYTVGFGHGTVLSIAGKILDHVKQGDLQHVFVIGGCDGFEGERSYYTDLAKTTPEKSLILSVGCGKYRMNDIDFGELPNTGLPRFLDMGQCNDSYSAVMVAVALSKALGCGVNDLPVSIALSWFEQKAVLVLLALLALGIKNIRVGPRLPAFITPTVLGVLVRDFGLKPVGIPKADLERMLANDK